MSAGKDNSSKDQNGFDDLTRPGVIAPFVNPVSSPQLPERRTCPTFAERMLAFASGLHPSIGADSPVQILTPELARIIMAYARPPTVVTGSQDKTARVWDLETGQCKAVCTGHRGVILCIEASANHVYTGSVDTTVRVWDAKTGACVGILRDSKHHVVALRVIRDSEILVSGSKDGHMYVYDMFNFTLLNTVSTPSPVFSMVYDDVDRQLIVGLASGLIMRYSVDTWEPVGEPITAHQSAVSILRIGSPINSLEKSRPFRTLISGCVFYSSNVTLWNMENWTVVSTLSLTSKSKVVDVQVAEYPCSGEQWLVVAMDDGTIREYNALTGAVFRNITSSSFVDCVTTIHIAPWRDVDLGNAWYADEEYIRDFLKPECRPVGLKYLQKADESQQIAAANAEHDNEEALAAKEYARSWDPSILGPCPVKHSARLLAVGHSDGTCSIFDYPRGSLVFKLPPLKSDEGHADSISAMTILELDAFHDFI